MNNYTGFSILLTVVIVVARIYLIFKRYDSRDELVTKREKEALDKIKLEIDAKKVLANTNEKYFNEFYVAKPGDDGGSAYIQNNTRLIQEEIAVFTPSFKSDRFLDFAKNVFKKAADKNQRFMMGALVSDKIDVTQFPESIERFDVCFLHNYIIEDDYESIKVLLNVDTNEHIRQRFFATFKRRNILFSATNGQVVSVDCPHCGGELEFGNKAYTKCPYCGNTVTFAEYDWILTEVERITNKTLITNVGVIKK